MCGTAARHPPSHRRDPLLLGCPPCAIRSHRTKESYRSTHRTCARFRDGSIAKDAAREDAEIVRVAEPTSSSPSSAPEGEMLGSREFAPAYPATLRPRPTQNSPASKSLVPAYATKPAPNRPRRFPPHLFPECAKTVTPQSCQLRYLEYGPSHPGRVLAKDRTRHDSYGPSLDKKGQFFSPLPLRPPPPLVILSSAQNLRICLCLCPCLRPCPCLCLCPCPCLSPHPVTSPAATASPPRSTAP